LFLIIFIGGVKYNLISGSDEKIIVVSSEIIKTIISLNGFI
jgi:hypothetical protein